MSASEENSSWSLASTATLKKGWFSVFSLSNIRAYEAEQISGSADTSLLILASGGMTAGLPRRAEDHDIGVMMPPVPGHPESVNGRRETARDH